MIRSLLSQSRSVFRIVVFIGLAGFSAWAADTAPAVEDVRNFGVVNEHLFRGAAPTVVGLSELSAAGVKLVIDLREAGAATEVEKRQAEKLGMKYTNIPLAPMSAPTAAQMRLVLNLLAQNQAQRVFVHCRRGKDRTGTVIACYRIQHDGWGNERALQEAKGFGMSPLEAGMRSFVMSFTPMVGMGEMAGAGR
jgi:protein tyrosine/serine phosphatase